MLALLTLLTLVASFATSSAKMLWDGRANGKTGTKFLANWDWSNQAGPYQYYIHGSKPVNRYVKLSPAFKNPADKGSKRGFQITIDETAHWNGQPMYRTELIPQTKVKINEGKVFYHFSVQHTGTNAPSTADEHQVAFFESHFTEMKFGGSSGNKLQWFANGQSHWSTPFKKGVWHNVAYGIDFSAGTVEYHHSVGGNPLVKKAGPVKVDASSNGQDWHLGVLRLPGSGAGKKEDWHFSGVYIENGGLTKSVSGPGGAKARRAIEA